jgi:hypothetical protein
MKASGIRALLVSAAFIAMAVADVASGTERGDGRMVAGTGMIGPAEPADSAGATDREGVPAEIGDGGADGPSDPAGAGEDDFEGDYAAADDRGAIAAGPHVRWKGRSGDDGAPSGQGESAQARAPPALLPATPTDPGA